MPLESGAVYISDLVPTNPNGDTDPKSEGDDHLKIIKSTIKTTFPNITGAVTATHTELNATNGMSGTADTTLTIAGRHADSAGSLKSWRLGEKKTISGSPATVVFTGVPTDVARLQFVLKTVDTSISDDIELTASGFSAHDGVIRRQNLATAAPGSIEALAWPANTIKVTWGQTTSTTGFLTFIKLDSDSWVLDSQTSSVFAATGFLYNTVGFVEDSGSTSFTFSTLNTATFSGGEIALFAYR